MKKTLTKILFISLLFSAAVPSKVQANFDWAAWGSGTIKSALRSGAREAISFLTENKIAVLGVAVGTALAWKMFNEYRRRKLEEEARQKVLEEARQRTLE